MFNFPPCESDLTSPMFHPVSDPSALAILKRKRPVSSGSAILPLRTSLPVLEIDCKDIVRGMQPVFSIVSSLKGRLVLVLRRAVAGPNSRKSAPPSSVSLALGTPVTITLKEQEVLLPEESVAVMVTLLVPALKV